MIPIRTEYAISIDDVCDHFNTHIGDYEFCQMAENGSYQIINCDDGTLEELWESYEWYKDKESLYAERIRNDINLIEYLRFQGHLGPILVYVCW
jgi:hypothetical protein